ncbi:MAG: zinc ribbon domain-containing protein [Chloroflexi bacterium]|nr:zinc ribbon domain-containing protein [Chloroflexota bacterium]
MAAHKQDKHQQVIEFTCPQCGTIVSVEQAGEVRACPACKHKLSKVVQLDQLLARWWVPRRWRADLVKPNVPYLVERLWTANGQGERLYAGVSPKFTNYDIFRNMVTRLMIRGIDDGWAELTFPGDPLAEDPQYVLTIVDSEQFAEGVEKLFPEVDWDEPVSAAVAEAVGLASPVKTKKKKKR